MFCFTYGERQIDRQRETERQMERERERESERLTEWRRHRNQLFFSDPLIKIIFNLVMMLLVIFSKIYILI